MELEGADSDEEEEHEENVQDKEVDPAIGVDDQTHEPELDSGVVATTSTDGPRRKAHNKSKKQAERSPNSESRTIQEAAGSPRSSPQITSHRPPEVLHKGSSQGTSDTAPTGVKGPAEDILGGLLETNLGSHLKRLSQDGSIRELEDYKTKLEGQLQVLLQHLKEVNEGLEKTAGSVVSGQAGARSLVPASVGMPEPETEVQQLRRMLIIAEEEEDAAADEAISADHPALGSSAAVRSLVRSSVRNASDIAAKASAAAKQAQKTQEAQRIREQLELAEMKAVQGREVDRLVRELQGNGPGRTSKGEEEEESDQEDEEMAKANAAMGSRNSMFVGRAAIHARTPSPKPSKPPNRKRVRGDEQSEVESKSERSALANDFDHSLMERIRGVTEGRLEHAHSGTDDDTHEQDELQDDKSTRGERARMSVSQRTSVAGRSSVIAGRSSVIAPEQHFDAKKAMTMERMMAKMEHKENVKAHQARRKAVDTATNEPVQAEEEEVQETEEERADREAMEKLALELKQPKIPTFAKAGDAPAEGQQHSDESRSPRRSRRGARRTRKEQTYVRAVMDPSQPMPSEGSDIKYSVKEFADVGLQDNELDWPSLPHQIITWMKLNLLQRMQSTLYCLKWEISDLHWFPELSQHERLELVRDFEEFLQGVMCLKQSSKHEVRRNFGKRYKAASRQRSASPSQERQRSESPRIGASRAMFEIPVLVKKLAKGDGRHEETHQMEASQVPVVGRTKPGEVRHGRIQMAGLDFPCREEAPPLSQAELGALAAKITAERGRTTPPLLAPDQRPRVSEVLGIHLPPAAFSGDAKESDPYCLKVASELGLRGIPDPPQEESQEPRRRSRYSCRRSRSMSMDASASSGDERKMSMRRATAVRRASEAAAELESAGVMQISPGLPPALQEQVLRREKLKRMGFLLEQVVRRCKRFYFGLLHSGTLMLTMSAPEGDSRRFGMTSGSRRRFRPNQRLPGDSGKSGKRRDQGLQPEYDERQYAGCIGWNYVGAPVQSLRPFEPEPEAPVLKEQWTRQRAEDLMKSIPLQSQMDTKQDMGTALPAIPTPRGKEKPDADKAAGASGADPVGSQANGALSSTCPTGWRVVPDTGNAFRKPGDSRGLPQISSPRKSPGSSAGSSSRRLIPL
eukprot:gnl/TRDRNA2_/TRDRNA2_173459_c1_seq6.p1 gnl/TRDRNA2_/TRDRNA2_173459_c1~~gnl/TRDRNA2_/TRDRNA2_173459_c1_seq6.p1  ORF type:complete len:1215 (-),score=240.21 gnl/TRDRNA2_/TRDRNA2_173459_c1_seq6:149-3571(-)